MMATQLIWAPQIDGVGSRRHGTLRVAHGCCYGLMVGGQRKSREEESPKIPKSLGHYSPPPWSSPNRLALDECSSEHGIAARMG